MKVATGHITMKIVSCATAGQYLTYHKFLHKCIPIVTRRGKISGSTSLRSHPNLYLPPSDYPNQTYVCHFWQHPNTSNLFISPGSKGSVNVNQKDITEESRSQNPYPGGCDDNRSWVRNDSNTQCHCPCFNQSVGFLPARQQVVISYVDK